MDFLGDKVEAAQVSSCVCQYSAAKHHYASTPHAPVIITDWYNISLEAAVQMDSSLTPYVSYCPKYYTHSLTICSVRMDILCAEISNDH
jgi:hypothetical protein